MRFVSGSATKLTRFGQYSNRLTGMDCRISGLQNFRVTEFQSYRIAEFQNYRIAEFQSFRISEFQACPTDFCNAEIEHNLCRSGGVAEFMRQNQVYISVVIRLTRVIRVQKKDCPDNSTVYDYSFSHKRSTTHFLPHTSYFFSFCQSLSLEPFFHFSLFTFHSSLSQSPLLSLPPSHYSFLTTHFSSLHSSLFTFHSSLSQSPLLSLPPSHYSFLTTHYSLFTFHFSLFTFHSSLSQSPLLSLPPSHYSSLTTHYSLFSFFTLHFSLFTLFTHYSSLTTHYSPSLSSLFTFHSFTLLSLSPLPLTLLLTTRLPTSDLRPPTSN